ASSLDLFAAAEMSFGTGVGAGVDGAIWKGVIENDSPPGDCMIGVLTLLLSRCIRCSSLRSMMCGTTVTSYPKSSVAGTALLVAKRNTENGSDDFCFSDCATNLSVIVSVGSTIGSLGQLLVGPYNRSGTIFRFVDWFDLLRE